MFCHKMAKFGLFHLALIAYIDSYIINYHYANIMLLSDRGSIPGLAT